MLDQLGAFLQPQQPQLAATPDPNLKSEWDGWLSDPKNRAGLLNAGLALMTPTWGSPAANAMGGFAEGYAGQEKLEQDEATRQANISLASADKEAERNLRRELNDADNKSAMERTKLTTEATTARASATAGGQYSRAGQALYNRVYMQEMKRLTTGDLVNGIDPVDEETATLGAAEAAARATDAFESRFGGAASGGNAGTATSANPAAPAAGGDNAPAPAKAPAANVEAPGKTAQTSVMTIDDLLSKTDPAKLDALLAKPNADDLLKKYGLSARLVKDEVNRRKMQQSARTWIEQLTAGGQPGVATPLNRGAGTGNIK